MTVLVYLSNESVQSIVLESRSSTELSSFAELKNQSLEFVEGEVARIWGPEKRCREALPRDSLEYLAKYWSVHAWEETAQG